MLPGTVEFAKHYLRLPVSIGVPSETDTIIDQVVDPSFATVVGLALWGSNFTSGGFGGFNIAKPFKGLLENENVVKLKKWFKAIMP